MARDKGCTAVEAKGELEMVVKQMRGEYGVNEPSLYPLYDRAQELADGFEKFETQHVPREKNREADQLVKKAFSVNASCDCSRPTSLVVWSSACEPKYSVVVTPARTTPTRRTTPILEACLRSGGEGRARRSRSSHSSFLAPSERTSRIRAIAKPHRTLGVVDSAVREQL